MAVRSGLKSSFLSLAEAEAGAGYGEFEDAQDRGSQHARETRVSPGGVDAGDPRLPVGDIAEGVPNGLLRNDMVTFNTIARRVDAVEARLHTIIDGDRARNPQGHTRGYHKVDPGPHAGCGQHQVALDQLAVLENKACLRDLDNAPVGAELYLIDGEMGRHRVAHGAIECRDSAYDQKTFHLADPASGGDAILRRASTAVRVDPFAMIGLISSSMSHGARAIHFDKAASSRASAVSVHAWAATRAVEQSASAQFVEHRSRFFLAKRRDAHCDVVERFDPDAAEPK